MGVDTAFNLYSEAVAGFANHVCNIFEEKRPTPRDLSQTFLPPR